MQYAAWLQGLTRGQVAPVVLLHGPEPFLIEEALAGLTRVVCSDPGLLAMSREVLEAREAGAEGIVRAAETLRTSPELRERLAHNALHYARKTFDLDQIADRFESLFLSLAGRTGRTPIELEYEEVAHGRA